MVEDSSGKPREVLAKVLAEGPIGAAKRKTLNGPVGEVREAHLPTADGASRTYEMVRTLLDQEELEEAMHPWHDIELGKKFPDVSSAVIEIPKNSNAKYKLDAKSGMLRLSEFLPTVARYPANYGFYPRTIAADGDALDVFVFGREPVVPLTLLDVKTLGGVATMSPKKGREEKLIAVCPADPEFARHSSIEDLPKHYLEQLCEFFEEYKALEGDRKRVKKFLSRKQAHEILSAAADDYAKQFNLGKLGRAA